ncbi:MAG TPA: hypothetical protein VNZ62_06900 [Capillimicrobium sp.]|nr:hypothetical protein [Capillimicrobium sp.]
MSLKHLASKLLAGGLTAGIVLIWWPRHYPTDGVQWLVARGVVATLGFELMLLAYAPVEDRLTRRLAGRLPVGGLRRRAQRLPAPARGAGMGAAAMAAIAVPIALLAGAGPAPDPVAPVTIERTSQPVKVVREVVVKRRVIHDEVAVPVPATGVSARSAPAASTRTAGAEPASAPRSRTSEPKERRATADPQPAEAVAETPPTTAPETAEPPPAAEGDAAPAPATAAAPAP